MSIDIAVSVAWDVLKCMVDPIKRQFGYMMSSKSCVQELQEEVRMLTAEVERIHEDTEEASNNLRIVNSHVEGWQTSAKKALTEAEALLGDFDKESKTCCYGTLPDPYCRYKFSRKAKKKIEAIQLLVREGNKFKKNNISCNPAATGKVLARTPARRDGKDVVQSATAIAGEGVFQSRASILKNIMDALADDRNSMVGVYGMAGVGKSTLLTVVERRIREENSFDWVINAEVSVNPDTKRIQRQIAHALGFSDIENQEDVIVRAALLRRRLEDEKTKKKKVLIILDNLWKGLDLKSVGIPCGHDNKVSGCKLLLTSRNQDVLKREMDCDNDFHLKGLQKEEARRLFERIMGDKFRDEEFKPLVDKALDVCAGFPFLILAVAKHYKHASLSESEDALRQIKMSKDEGIGKMLNNMLQLSYDHLKVPDAKLLLQLLVVYGVSKPSFDNLVRYGVGWGLFGENTRMEDARNRLKSLIHILRASSLLLENGDNDGFKIHDLVREFVASVASKDHPLLVLRDKDELVTDLPKDKLKSCRAMCFPYNDMKELPEELDCPKLEIFLLFTNNKALKVPNSLFNSMRKLMVVNLTGIHLTHSPSSLQFLESLRSLCLDGCSVEDVAILGKLKGLQILSLVNSKIQRLPKEIRQLANLRLLDLNNCSRLQIIEPGVLGSLIKLEELYMENSFDQWNALGQTPPTNASLVELNNMNKLRILHVSIADPSVLPDDLNVENFSQYRIRIGDVWRWSSYKGLRTLKLKLDPLGDVLQKGCIRATLDRIDDLFLDGLNGFKQSICDLSPYGFPQLKHVCVWNCPSVRYILRSPSHSAFEKLESLLLKNLINLEKICHSHISFKSFSTLKVVQVENCDKMEVLFPLSLVGKLPWLEAIEVGSCKQMREIVEANGSGKVDLHNLRELMLRDLPNVNNFFNTMMAPSSSTSNDQAQVAFFNRKQVTFPSLETLYIGGMDNIKMIWDNQVILPFSTYFQHLKTLDVSHCDGLSNMFTSTIARNLVALTNLRISNCKILTAVISGDGGKDGHIVAFKQLKSVELDELIGLRGFSSGGCTLIFPLLEHVIVTRCFNMKIFSDGPIEAPKLKRVLELDTGVWFWKEDLNRTIQRMFEKTATVDVVESTWLFEIGKRHSKLESIMPQQLESVVVDKRPSFINAIPSKLMLVLDNMRKLQVCNCESLEEIFDLEGLETLKSPWMLPCLENLDLVDLPKLRRLWNKDLQGMLKFNHLFRLTFYNCSNLRHAFTRSMARCLANLVRMEIKECGQMEGVILEEEGQGSAVEKIRFWRLRWMKLERLPSLTSFLSEKNHTLECPGLEELTIAHCPNMRSFTWQSPVEIDHGTPSLFTSQVQFPQLKSMVLSHMGNLSKIWTNDFQENLTCKHLRKVEVRNCGRLENLFSHWVATNLSQLEELHVESCGLDEIVTSEDDIAQVLFPKLTSLVLHDMPRLKSFCPNLPTLNWQFLEELRVTCCDKLNCNPLQHP